MKIALIADTHHGCRNDSDVFETNIERFNHEILFPILKKHEIKTIIHLGDLVDRRKYISYATAKRMRQNFIEPLIEMGADCYFIIGNHDIALRESLSINAQKELLNWPRGGLIDHPWPFNLDGWDVLLVPWICPENEKEVLAAINRYHGLSILGHFEMCGFEVESGRVQDKGLDPAIFNRFEFVGSGHYHHQSQRGNVRYLGATREITWSDYNDPRGFHIFDTQTRQLEFFQNPYPVFVKAEIGKHEDIDMKNKIVRLTAPEDYDPVRLEILLKDIAKTNPASLQVVEHNKRIQISDFELTDTLSMLLSCANETVECDKGLLKDFLVGLYQEAESHVVES